MYLASNHQVFQKNEKEVDKCIRKNSRPDKDTKEPAPKAPSKKPSSEHEKYSEYSSSSSSGTLYYKSHNRKRIFHKKKSVVGLSS